MTARTQGRAIRNVPARPPRRRYANHRAVRLLSAGHMALFIAVCVAAFTTVVSVASGGAVPVRWYTPSAIVAAASMVAYWLAHRIGTRQPTATAAAPAPAVYVAPAPAPAVAPAPVVYAPAGPPRIRPEFAPAWTREPEPVAEPAPAGPIYVPEPAPAPVAVERDREEVA